MPASPHSPSPSAKLSIRVNGTSQEVHADTTVAAWVAAQGWHPHQVAVEVNGELVPRGERESVCFQAGDKVETVTLVGGG